jgi:3-deoxy-7-phosphoheptulonate synthase
MAKDWTPASWRGAQARQQPAYPDPAALQKVLSELVLAPPLVPASRALALKARLAQAQEGRAFLLQAGDCAESLDDCSSAKVRRDLGLIEAVAERLAAAAALPVVRVARMAGQYAKPRTRDVEDRHGRQLPIYRGESVNGFGFDPAERAADPERMLRAYAQSAATLREMEAAAPEVFAGHEALLLPYEEALVRRHGRGWYGSSAHFLWIGDRTRFEGSAHVELLRGISNPIGMKCGPTLESEALVALLDRLDPLREPGRITLISRMGADLVGDRLPPLLRAVRREGHRVLWCCDPMHGNTRRAGNGFKTRQVESIAGEVGGFFAVCRSEGSVPGGIHLEMTGDDVAECTGGSAGIVEGDLPGRFRSYCDPRLNPSQALEIAQVVVEALGGGRSAVAA